MQDRETATNSVLREYTWGMSFGGGIGGLLSMRQNGEDFYYLYDGTGNVSSVVDSNQQVVASYQYNAFGRLMNVTGTLEQPFQFSTKRYDAGTGLNYYGYRFYAPAIERWLNRDPIGEAGGINLYGFVGGDPVNWVDPWGLITLYSGDSIHYDSDGYAIDTSNLDQDLRDIQAALDEFPDYSWIDDYLNPKPIPPKEKSCIVDCLRDALFGKPNHVYNGELATRIEGAMGKYALGLARKKAMKTFAVKAGSFLVPILGDISTAKTALDFGKCLDCCRGK